MDYDDDSRSDDCEKRLLVEEKEEFPTRVKPVRRYPTNGQILILSIITVVSVLINIYLVSVSNHQSNRRGVNPSFFAGVAYDTHIQYHSRTDYWGDNQTLADELWDSIHTGPLEIALSDEEATSYGIPISVFRFPWDHSKGIYFIKAFHQLHCLKILRRSLIDYERGNPRIIQSHHLYHCLDSLRQDVICNADDYPMPTVHLPAFVGDGQIRVCRNLDKLIEWVNEGQRSACHHHFNDYQVVKNKLEMYAFCPEDSPYREVAETYFRKWGHKDPLELMTEEDKDKLDILAAEVEASQEAQEINS